MSDNEKTRYRATKMGYVFQAFNLLPVLTASGKRRDAAPDIRYEGKRGPGEGQRGLEPGQPAGVDRPLSDGTLRRAAADESP